MYESNNKYRVSKLKNNYLKQEEPQKMSSIHSSNIKSPSKNKNQRKRSQNRYDQERLSNSKASLNSSNKNYRPRTPSNNCVIQFNDVKWLSIISIYDPKKLKNVTASYNSYGKFLKNNDVRKDQYGKNQYKGVIRNFRKWAEKINKGYTNILNIFLYPPLHSSPIETFAKVKPMLDKIKCESEQMHNKVKYCLDIQAYREFQDLLYKFDTFFEASKDIEQIIFIVNKSKNNIDDLFQEIERDPNLEKKVEKQRKKGIKMVRKAVKDYKDDEAEAKILDKVEAAINEMADKTLEAYSKIKGARALIQKIKRVFGEKRDMDNLQLYDIITVNKIFQQVLFEATQFQKFSSNFLQQSNNIINDDLRKCIERYMEEVNYKKQTVYEMELQFILTIIESTVQLLTSNYSICNGIDSECFIEFKKIQELLTQICKCLCDESKKAIVEDMIKNTKQSFRHLKEILRVLKKFNGSVQIDTEQGLGRLRELYRETTDYKNTIKLILSKEEKSYEVIKKKAKHRLKREQIPDDNDDLQLKYMKDLIKLSQKINSAQKLKQLNSCPAYSEIDPSESLTTVASGLKDIKIIKWAKKGYNQYTELKNNNEMGTIITNLRISNALFQLSPLILQLSQVYTHKESNLLIQLSKLSELYNKFTLRESPIHTFFQRSIAFIVCRGLKKQLLNTIQNTNLLQFPSNQSDIKSLQSNIQYLGLVKKSINNTFPYYKIQSCCQVMKQLIQGVLLSQQLKWNQQGLYYLHNHRLCSLIDQLFESTFGNQSQFQIQQIIRELNLCISNLNKLHHQETHSQNHQIRKQQMSTLINKYKKMNQQLLNKLQSMTESEPLIFYSQMVYYLTNYLHETKQSAYVVVNSHHQPLWICMKSVGEYSAIGAKIGAQRMLKGEMLKDYKRECAIVVESENVRQKQVKSVFEQNMNNDDMQEQIMDEDNEMGEQIQEQDNQIQEMEDNIQIDDQESIQEMQSNSSQSLSQRKHSPYSQSQQQSHQEIVQIKEKKLNYLYQSIPIHTLQQLQSLINNIRHLPTLYWTHCDYQRLQHFINTSQPQSTTLTQHLLTQLQALCRQHFNAHLLSTVKASHNYQQITNSIHDVIHHNKSTLSQILRMVGKRYSKMMESEEVLWINIEGEKWSSIDCVRGYMENMIKEAKLQSLGTFQLQQYCRKLKKSKNGLQTIYTVEEKGLQPSKETIQQYIKNTNKIQEDYQWSNSDQIINLTSYGDGLHIQEFILDLWIKTVEDRTLTINSPHKLNQDIQHLHIVNQPQHCIHYFTNYRQTIMGLHDQLYNHKLRLQTIAIHTSHSNILHNIGILADTYKPKNVITHNAVIFVKQPTLVLSQRNQLQSLIVTLFESISCIHNVLQQKWELCIRYFEPLYKLLNILKIQTYIWEAKTGTIISKEHETVLKHIVAEGTDQIIKSLQQFSKEGMDELSDHLRECTIKHNEFVHEYKVKQTSALSTLNNTKFRQSYNRLLGQIESRYTHHQRIEDKVIRSVIYDVLDMAEQDNESVMVYITFLQQILNQPVFNSTSYTHLYKHHKETNITLNHISNQLQDELSVLSDVFGDIKPILQTNVQDIPKYLNHKYELVIRWLQEYRKIQSRIKLVKVCGCDDELCDGSSGNVVHVGLGTQACAVERILQIITVYPDKLHGYIKNSIRQHKNCYIIHIDHLLQAILQKIEPNLSEEYNRLLSMFNHHHFKDRAEKQIMEQCQLITQQIQRKVDALTYLSHIQSKITQSNSLFIILTKALNLPANLQHLKSNCQTQISHIRSKPIHSISYTYPQFLSLYTHIAQVLHLQFYMLFNGHTDDVVCLLPKHLPLSSSLSSLSLPTEYTIEDDVKIRLNDQKYKAKLEVSVSEEEWQAFVNNRFGLKKDEGANDTCIISIFIRQGNEEKMVGVCNLKDHELQEWIQVYSDMSSDSIKKDMVFYLTQVQDNTYTIQNYDTHIHQILQKQQFACAYLSDTLRLQKIGSYLTNMHSEQVIRIREGEIQKQQQQQEQNLQEQDQEQEQKKEVQKEVNRYLQILYDGLSKADVFQLQKTEIQQQQGLEQAELKSKNSIMIKDKTVEVINKSSKEIPQEDLKEFRRISNYYIYSLEKLLITREELIEQLLMKANQQPTPILEEEEEHKENTQYMQNLLSELQGNTLYRESSKSHLQCLIQELKGRQRDIIWMGHRRRR